MHKETTKIALYVIAGASFGYSFEWDDSEKNIPPGHNMSFRDSIRITVDNLITLIAVPSLLLKLPIQHLQNTSQAYKELGIYLQDIIDLGKQQAKSSGNTVLSQLIAPSGEVSQQLKFRPLDDSEIMGNCFIFISAGYETTYVASFMDLIIVQTHYFMHFIY